MKQEEKDLLLKDLCGRLTYGVKVKFGDSKPALLTVIEHDEFGWQIGSEDEFGGMITIIDNVKPYLFPLSSMSEDQKYEFYLKFIVNDCDFDCFKFYLDNGNWHKLLTSLDDIEAIIDWFHKNHIDYRGLIPMGLAIDATGLNIY